MKHPVVLPKTTARQIWLRAQRLDSREPFGDGPEATRLAIEHLGYVQIDTIHVIERSHHHILWARIPSYQRKHLHQAQTIDKSVFEYWTHALSYVPVGDFRFFLPAMKAARKTHPWWGAVSDAEMRKVLTLIRENGPISIRDITDDVPVEKTHLWASRKPSKRALEVAWTRGQVAISEREGMLKKYELMDRHFGWEQPPRAATERQILGYLLDRALRCQGLVSVDSVAYHAPKRKKPIRELIDGKVRRKELVPVTLEGAEKAQHWATPQTLDEIPVQQGNLVHILSPFDPLIINRKRLELFFDYEHIFEAYVPKDKRVYGYFTLPVLVGEEIVASLDLKTDRANGSVLIQQWNWIGTGSARAHKRLIHDELARFEQFQLSP